MKNNRLLGIAGFVVATLPAVALSQATWHPYVSEENGGPWALCPTSTEAVSGVRCRGSYCDEVGIRCQDLPADITVSGYHLSDSFSEEGGHIATSSSFGWYRSDSPNSHVCNWGQSDPGVVTGLRCTGSYCDNIQLECATPIATLNGRNEPVRFTNCSWSGWYSEEDPWFAYGATANQYIAGIECSGSYCDDKRYYVCRMEVVLNSCRDRCDGVAPAGCYCDDVCEQFGDCCPDYAVECGGAGQL